MRGFNQSKVCTALMVIFILLFVNACGGAKNENAAPASSSSSEQPSEAASEQATEQAVEQPVEKVKLKVLAHSSWIKGGMEAVAKDAAEKLGIELEFDKVPEGTQGMDVIKTRFATQDLPDILLYFQGETNLAPLGDPEALFVPQDDQPWMANFDKAAWKGQVDYRGKYLSAPYMGVAIAPVLYNKKVFESLGLQIPTNYTEFLAVCEALKTAGKVPVYISGKDSWTLQLFGIESTAQPNYMDYVGNLNTNKAKFAEWEDFKLGLTTMMDLKDKEYYNKEFLSASYDDAQKALATGEAGMYLMGGWVMDEIRKKYPDQLNDIGAFIMPFRGDNKDLVAAYPPNAMYVIKGGKNQEAAQKFVNFFESIEEQNVYFANEGGIPAIMGVTETMLTSAEVDGKQFVDAGKVAPLWGIGFIHDVSQFATYAQDLIAGGKTVDKLLESLDKDYVKSAQSKNDPNY